ncbi:helix-turn-helix transcriptional regulator [Streptomyces sp. CA-106110]|uniref:helix-turn-helix transcriptional regulator n=1 Tax=Streptomyces sp. CA-106110 TaxID=3240044 RepID=UPI003D8A7FD5
MSWIPLSVLEEEKIGIRHPGEGRSRPVALVGRSPELAVLGSAVDQVHEAGAALLLRGEPGVGKTVLLDWAADHAVQAGFWVLRAAGVEQESELAFAALHQVLYPLLDRIGELPLAQQTALNRAFGVVDGGAPDRFAVSVAALALLQHAAHTEPLLVIADDVQWVDASSAQILSFIQRRIAPLPVVVLTAARNGWRNPLDSAGIDMLDVAPLPAQDAAALLASAHPGLAAPTARCVLGEAMGNPLALVELPAQLTRRQQRGADPLPSWLPLGERLEEGFAGRIRTLPQPVRNTMLLAALTGGGPGGLRTVREAARTWHGWDEEALDAGQASGLVTVDAGSEKIVFRHPLVRSAVVRMAPLVVRRAAHQALAEVLTADPVRRAWHLADAADGSDEIAAQALVDAAERDLNRGGAAEATVALARAAELSPDPHDRALRLVEAAFVAVTGGQLQTAERLLKATEQEELPIELALRRTTTAALLMLHRDGDAEGAYQAILPVAEAIGPDERHDPAVEDAFDVLMRACFWLGGGQERWEPVRQFLDRVSSLARLAYDAAADPARTAHTVRERLQRAVTELPQGRRTTRAYWLVGAAHSIEAFGDFTAVWRELMERCSYESQPLVMPTRQYDAYARGRWEEVEALSEEGIERSHSDNFTYLLRSVEAQVAASRGDQARLQTLSDTITAWARPRRMNRLLRRVTEAHVREAVTRGAYEEAYARASALTPPGELPAFFQHFHRVFLDLVEACIRTGRIDQARAHVAAGQAARIDAISSRHALILAGSAALAADDEQADTLFQAALAEPDADQWPFELARIQLAYGEWLRRRSDRTAARVHLGQALEIFRRLQAEPWAKRACEELRTAGTPQTAATVPGLASLSPQELRIAELAAQGMTNKQIGQLLHVSPRTIGAHLYKIFPKLGITSRVMLRDSLLAS